MSINLESFKKDIDYFTNNFCKFKLLVLFVENNNMTSILKKNINIENNYLPNKELIQYIQNIKELRNHKIQYLLNFTIKKSIEELEELYIPQPAYIKEQIAHYLLTSQVPTPWWIQRGLI